MLFLRRGHQGIVQQWCRCLAASHAAANNLASNTCSVAESTANAWQYNVHTLASSTTRLDVGCVADPTQSWRAGDLLQWHRAFSKSMRDVH